MATADAYGIEVGKTYRHCRRKSPDRYVIWISGDGERIQYDSDSVRMGAKFPTVTADKFATWAGLTAGES